MSAMNDDESKGEQSDTSFGAEEQALRQPPNREVDEDLTKYRGVPNDGRVDAEDEERGKEAP